MPRLSTDTLSMAAGSSVQVSKAALFQEELRKMKEKHEAVKKKRMEDEHLMLVPLLEKDSSVESVGEE